MDPKFLGHPGMIFHDHLYKRIPGPPGLHTASHLKVENLGFSDALVPYIPWAELEEKCHQNHLGKIHSPTHALHRQHRCTDFGGWFFIRDDKFLDKATGTQLHLLEKEIQTQQKTKGVLLSNANFAPLFGSDLSGNKWRINVNRSCSMFFIAIEWTKNTYTKNKHGYNITYLKQRKPTSSDSWFNLPMTFLLFSGASLNRPMAVKPLHWVTVKLDPLNSTLEGCDQFILRTTPFRSKTKNKTPSHRNRIFWFL